MVILRYWCILICVYFNSVLIAISKFFYDIFCCDKSFRSFYNQGAFYFNNFSLYCLVFIYIECSKVCWKIIFWFFHLLPLWIVAMATKFKIGHNWYNICILQSNRFLKMYTYIEFIWIFHNEYSHFLRRVDFSIFSLIITLNCCYGNQIQNWA